MTTKRGRSLLSFLLLMMMLFMISCTKNPSVSEPAEQISPTAAAITDEKEDADDGKLFENKLIDNSSDGEENVVYKVTYYTVDTKSLQLVQSIAAVKGGSSLEPIKVLELVADALEDSSLTISFNGAYFDRKGYCIIDFKDSIKEISKKDHNLETLILNACGQSILDNIDLPGVIVRIDDGKYVTDQYDFDKDYVYTDM